jgi:CxxC motif-containing protein (DUF1111 family)
MTRRTRVACAGAILVAATVGAGCSKRNDSKRDDSWMTALASGGRATVTERSRTAFTQPAPELPPSDLPAFALGNRIFSTPWVEAPSSVDKFDGLGPYFSTRSCSGCHLRDGRGRPPESADEVTAMVVKLALLTPGGALGPDPHYGIQLSERAIQGITPEGRIAITWQPRSETYPDGSTIELRQPSYRMVELGYGDLAPETKLSPRIAPGVFGAGLLEGVPDSVLLALANPKDANADGISGRVHWVRDPETGKRRTGRFGWKSIQPTVTGQVTTALVMDMGITTSVRPEVELTSVQAAARDRPTGGSPELEGKNFAALVSYCRTLGVPERRGLEDPVVMRGAARFREAKCVSCHVPTLPVGQASHPAVSETVIHPYTDLLLHDLGPELSDGMPEGAAAASEWRTAPLWGIGLAERVDGYRFLLHDGRARTPEEAILWHGGEASASREAFRRLPAAARQDLLTFLESL